MGWTATDDIGSADPLNSDSDNDGMPDGWEIFHARWSLFDDDWTLNPVNGGDELGDPDLDGCQIGRSIIQLIAK